MEPLHHANVTGMIGLLELLREREGKQDVYRLGRELHYELDDLLPITEAAKACGLVVIEAGDIELTQLGTTLADAEEFRRMALLREPVQRLPVIAEIRRLIRSAKGSSLSREKVLDRLGEFFSALEAARQAETAIQWGRYAGLFEYEADTDEFRIP